MSHHDVDDLLARVAEWAAEREDVRAVVLVGSQARTDHPADEWSDVDLILAVDDPAPFLDDTGWLAPFGRVLTSMLEPTAAGGMQERRVLFATGLDVDFTVLPAEVLRFLPEMGDDPGVRATIGHGVRVLHDELGFGDLLDAVEPPAPAGLPDEQAFAEVCRTFWYDAVWTAKKLRRGEVWIAKQSCDGQLLKGLVEALRWRTRLRHPGRETWHGLRFAEEWLDPDDAALLATTAARPDAEDVATALRRLVDAFAAAEAELTSSIGVEDPVTVDELRTLVDTILDATS